MALDRQEILVKCLIKDCVYFANTHLQYIPMHKNEPEKVYQKNYGDKLLEITKLKSQELNLEEMNILRKASKILRSKILEHRKAHLQDFT